MANNFAEAFLGARNAAQDRIRQQQQDAQANQMRQFQMEQAQAQATNAAQDRSQTQLLSMARGWKTVQPQNRQAYYERFIKPAITQQFGDPGPYDENAINSVADQIIAAYTPVGGSELAPRVVGDALVDPTGRVLYQAPQQQEYQWSDRAGAWIPKPGAPVNVPSSGVGPDGAQYRLGEDLTPEQREAAMADIAASGGRNAYQLQPRTQGGLQAIPVAGISPKDDGPEETFSQPQPVTYPDGSVRLVQFGNRGSRREVEGVAPPPTDRDAKPPTEGERKAATLLQRLNFSLNQLEGAVRESPDAASPSLAAEAARRLPLVGEATANAITPANRQRVEAAQLDILDAALTLGTGAAYTKEQLEGYRRSYFPQIGDSDATIKDKAARLNNVIEAARIAAGRAAPGASGGSRYQLGQIIEANGKRYRITGLDDPNDPDVEEVR